MAVYSSLEINWGFLKIKMASLFIMFHARALTGVNATLILPIS